MPATNWTATTALSAGLTKEYISSKNSFHFLDQVQVGGACEPAPQEAPGHEQEQCLPDLFSGWAEKKELNREKFMAKKKDLFSGFHPT